MSFLKSLNRLAENITDIATAPIKIAVDATTIVTEPIKHLANEVSEAVEEVTKEIIDEEGK